MFCCQIQIAGEVLPVKCPAKFLSEECGVSVCGEVCGERSAKCLLLCSSLNSPRNFTTNFNMHHSLGPKQNQAAKFSPPNIFIKIFVAQSGFEICGVGVLMQRISERLKSTIADVG
jgi:hypothetical protein